MKFPRGVKIKGGELPDSPGVYLMKKCWRQDSITYQVRTWLSTCYFCKNLFKNSSLSIVAIFISLPSREMFF